jgi:transcriptional regulator with XRE-family HTH domain
MITPTQMRAARAILDISQGEAAKLLGIAPNTLSKIESGQADPPASRIDEIQKIYEAQGIEFTEGDGARRRQSYVHRYSGVEGFRAFMDDVYETSKKYGGELCLFNTQPSLWLKYLGREWYSMHTERMGKIEPRLRVRIAIREGDDSFIFPIAEYRWIPKDKWKDKTFYAYGPKLGLLNFKGDEDIEILVINESEFADSFRVLYEMAWQNETTKPLKSEV